MAEYWNASTGEYRKGDPVDRIGLEGVIDKNYPTQYEGWYINPETAGVQGVPWWFWKLQSVSGGKAIVREATAAEKAVIRVKLQIE